MFKQIQFHLQGVVPLICHNGQLADPTHPISRAIKKIHSSKKRSEVLTDDQFEEIKRLEFLGSLYVNESNKPVLPGEGIEAAIREMAKKRRKGKATQYAVMCDEDPEIIYSGPKNPDKMFKNKDFVFTKPVKIGTNKIMRTRARFKEWEIKFTLQYMPEVFSMNELVDIIREGGVCCGMFDWRPKYGRFRVLSPTPEGE